MSASDRERRRRLDLLHASHLALASALGAGWVLRAGGEPLSSSAAGRAIALGATVAGVAALAAVLVLTARQRRDVRALLLLALLAAAIASRRSPDALDAAYAVAAAAAGALWFLRGRRALSAPAARSGAPAGTPEEPGV